ncbi:phytanoyl-CoA dioxygenase family protein [Pseudoalteromonas sp. XMcav11-Q]|uniref:phytanoyl-CoA dioxygenase family protein n=1 Tax=Pseudoalteromonas sp. XMcav11-Q TaxID=3136665 RepID=UPI0032C46CF9
MFECEYDFNQKRQHYLDNGVVGFEKLIGEDLLERLEACFDRIIEGNYLTGAPPTNRTHMPNDSYDNLTRISCPAIADPQMVSLLMEAGIGVVANALSESDFVQAWGIQLINKVPGEGPEFNIGWHQDGQYSPWLFEGDWITAHITLSDVNEDDAPVLYIEDSHHLPTFKQGLHKGQITGQAFKADLYEHGLVLAERLNVPWKVKYHTSKRGDVNFHHSRLIHASDNLRSGKTRKTFSIHMRTSHNPLVINEPFLIRNNPPQTSYYLDFADQLMCPVIHGVATDLVGFAAPKQTFEELNRV